MGREGRADKRARGSESRRRAGTYLAQLAWLEGFPLDGGWYRLDTHETIALDGGLISRSRRAARTALREHREALAELVDDVDAWWSAVDARLAWCSAPHGVLDLFGLVAPRIARRARAVAHGELGAAVIAAGVAWAAQPRRLAHALDWLAARGELVDDVATTLALAELAELAGAPGVDAVIALCQVDAPDPKLAVEAVVNLGHRLRSGSAGATQTGPRSGVLARAWRERLLRSEPAVQRRALAVLAVVEPAAALAPWAAWERAHAARLARAHQFAERDFDRRSRIAGGGAPDGSAGGAGVRPRGIDRRREADNVAGTLAGLDEVRASAPPACALGELLTNVDLLASEAKAAFHAPAVRLLAALPDAAPIDPTAVIGGPPRDPATPIRRARMLAHLAHIADVSGPPAAWLWDALAAALEAGEPAGLLGPWQHVLTSPGRTYIDDTLVEHIARRAEIDRLLGALSALAAVGAVTELDAGRAAAAIAGGLAEPSVAPLVIAVRDIDARLWPEVVRMIAALSDGSVKDVVALAPIVLAAVAELPLHDVHSLGKLVEYAVGTGAGWLLRAAFVEHQVRVLSSVANLLPAVARAHWPALVTARRAPWIARYPEALAAALRRLASVDDGAEHTAARRLATDLPDPVDLQREIATLRARPALAAGPAKRLANLERRLASPGTPSPVRLARLAAKLEHTAATLGLARFVDHVTAAASARFARVFAGGAWPDPLDRRTREILVALTLLDQRDRALAARLLVKRSGPRPWDLREDRANLAFLAAMRAAGLAPEPWLDDVPTVVATAGGEVELALCADPLEVFAMGAHFETCLAPRGCNFFSVVANAADINKRVLYARRAGKVIGRCLLAITDGFGLLTFNPYCHDGGLDFAAHVGRFAVELAGKMRTRVVGHGPVRLLVAREWYDDGAYDLVGRFGALDDEQLGLGAVAPGELLPRLQAALGRALDDLTLPLVLALPSLRKRPELIASLAPYVVAAQSPATHIAAAELALAAGDPALADHLLGEHAAAIPLAYHAWPAGKLLARLRPSFALAWLRTTRARGVRGWPDDDGDRIAVAALAMATLRRPTKAAELYRLALERAPYLEAELRPYLAALDGETTAPA